LVEFLYTRANAGTYEENPTLEPESIMLSFPVPPEKQADIERLAREIHEAVDAEINELAANLATTDDAHLFGDNEFTIRALAHKIAAKAVERHLAQKKTGTKAPA
jgi:hypothetical protein